MPIPLPAITESAFSLRRRRIARVTVFCLFVGLSLTTVSSPLEAADEKAKKFSALLKPVGFSAKGTNKDIGTPKAKIVSVIQQMERSSRTNGPAPESLLENAFSFRKDLGSLEKTVTANAYLQNWRNATALGLFDQRGGFHSIIKRGSETGKTVSVQYIIPPSLLPEMSRHPANVRIVTPREKRTEKITDLSQLSPRDKAHYDQFKKMITEAQGVVKLKKIETPAKFGGAGLTIEEEHRRWEVAVKDSGDAAKAKPRITLRASTGATPASINKNRWRVDVEIFNASRHPTKIDLEYWLVGVSDKKNRHYTMKKAVIPIELVAGQTKKVTLWSNSKESYKNKSGTLDGLSKKQLKGAKVIFRGYLLRANHTSGEVAVFSPDRNLAQYLDEESERSTSQLK